MFSVNGPIALTAGSSATLATRNVSSDCFTSSYGNVLFRRSGVYYAALTVDIPENSVVDTTVKLDLDGQEIVPSAINVTTTSDSASDNFAGHAVFRAEEGSVLKIVSKDAMTVNQATATPLFTLTLVRID